MSNFPHLRALRRYRRRANPTARDLDAVEAARAADPSICEPAWHLDVQSTKVQRSTRVRGTAELRCRFGMVQQSIPSEIDSIRNLELITPPVIMLCV